MYKFIIYFVLQVLWESETTLICISDLNKSGTKQRVAALVEFLSMAVLQKLLSKSVENVLLSQRFQ